MRHLLTAGVMSGLLCFGTPAFVHGDNTPATHPRLDGAWTLNRQMGNSTQRGGYAGGEGDGDGRGGGRRPGGFGMGGGGMRPMGGGAMPDREEMARRRALIREMLEPSPRLTITTDGDRITFTDTDGRVRQYTADGRKEKHQFDNGTVKTKTKWDEDHLVIETSLDDGVKLTETYALAPETHQLVVQSKMEGGPMRGGERPPITHYYDNLNAAQ